MITVHHLGISQSERIVWLCEELGLPYTLQRYDRDPQTRLAPADYRALSEMGIAPVIDDGPLRLGESGAIIEYILGRYGNGQLAPAAADASFPDYLFWFHFANGTMMPSEMTGVIVNYLGLAPDHPMLQLMKARGDRAYAAVEQRLGEADYFAGSAFTAADIMMLFPFTTMRHFAPRDLGAYPNLRAYLARIGARPAYQRAMAKGDPGLELLLS
jgi:glutathione S-transferase